MPLPKPRENLKLAILLPCYKRNEYTAKCFESIKRCDKPCDVQLYLYDDGCPDGGEFFNTLDYNGSNTITVTNPINRGLRNVIIDFIERVRSEFDYIVKIDNDCVVPVNWLTGMLDVFENTNVEILSPNVMPSNAAFVYGKRDIEKLGYRPADVVGGLWMMPTRLVKEMFFEQHNTPGLAGAIPLLRQIVLENDPKIGWTPDVIVEDIGHWSGKHPEHIKSIEHEIYSKEVGRSIAWKSADEHCVSQ